MSMPKKQRRLNQEANELVCAAAEVIAGLPMQERNRFAGLLVEHISTLGAISKSARWAMEFERLGWLLGEVEQLRSYLCKEGFVAKPRIDAKPTRLDAKPTL